MGAIDKAERIEKRARNKAERQREKDEKKRAKHLEQEEKRTLQQSTNKELRDAEKTVVTSQTFKETENIKQEISSWWSEKQNNSSENLSPSALQETINDLCNFSTYGELIAKLTDCEHIFADLADTKKYWLAKSGKEGIKKVKAIAKSYLRTYVTPWKRRLIIENHPDDEPIIADGPKSPLMVYKNEMTKYHDTIKNLLSDTASWFTGRMQTDADFNLNSGESINKDIKRTEKVAQCKLQLNELLNRALVQEAFNNRLDYANQFLTHVLEGKLTQEDIIFYNQYWAKVKESMKDTSFPELIDLAYRNSCITPERYCGADIPNLKGVSWADAYKKYWLPWLFKCGLDSFTNMSNRTAQNWGKALSLWVFWLLWRGAWKLIKSEKDWKTAWGKTLLNGTLLVWWSLFACQAITWKWLADNLAGIWSWWDNIFSTLIDSLTNSGTPEGQASNRYEQFFNSYNHSNKLLSLPVLFPTQTLGDIQTLMNTFKADPNAWSLYRTQVMNKYNNTTVWQAISEYFPENYNENRFQEFIELSWADLDNDDKKTTMSELTLKKYFQESLQEKGYDLADDKKIGDLTKYLEEHKYPKLEGETLEELTKKGILKPIEEEEEEEDDDDDDNEQPMKEAQT